MDMAYIFDIDVNIFKLIMNKTTSSIISFLLIGLVVFGGRKLGLGLLERVIAVIIVLGLFELIKSKLKK